MKSRTFANYSAACVIGASISIAACTSNSGSQSSGSTPVTSTQASQVIAAVNGGVQGAGNGLGQTAVGGNSIAQVDNGFMKYILPKAYAAGGGVNSYCNSSAQPLAGDGATPIDSSNANYPALVFFCALAQNTHDSDSAQGSYELVQSITCAAGNAGVTWDGQPHTLTVTIDTTCFTAQQITNMGVPQTMSVTITASQPAAFNSHYAAGMVLQVPNLGTVSVGTTVGDSKYEFMVLEQDTAGGSTNKTGSYAGAFNSATGELWYESRFDRLFGADCASGSCGWSRHMRVYAMLDVNSSGNPTRLNSISGAFTEANSGSTYTVEADSISGSIATGILARNWESTDVVGSTSASVDAVIIGAGAGVDTYAETAYASNANCFGLDSSGASTCNSGIAIPSTTTAPGAAFPFSQTGSGDGVGFTEPVAWGSGLTSGLTFSSVTFADVQ